MSNARCHIFTEKDGLLSKVAHDLRIRVDRFDVNVEGAGDARQVTATFDPKSLVVETALSKGADSPSALSAKDRAKIEKSIQNDVLEVRRNAEIRFTSRSVEERGAGLIVIGDLTLHGRTRSLTVEVRDGGDAWQASVTLHQPDFGIKPFSAMMGTLKVKADLRVEISVPKSDG
ncbi:MAG: YceI family protein [Deltaproteobacteria bacterium]|nr:YceI family protein [Deltaproteobacteria bacterium]